MTKFSIATWNVNSLRVRLPHVLQWLDQTRPDVLTLQETKLPDADFPYDALRESGYSAIISGQKTYNGVAILSKLPINNHDIITDLPHLTEPDPQRRLLAATINDIRIINLYIPNGQSVGSDKYLYKLNWLTHLDLFLIDQLKMYPNIVILGDFNIAPEAIDVHDPKQWEGSVLVSEKEREAFRNIINIGFKDCFRLHTVDGKHYTWWDYRLNAFKRKMGLRIDHILASNALSATCTRCLIDANPRSLERPSDHAPVIAEFALA
jgi:exodeoxyribonuclease-3